MANRSFTNSNDLIKYLQPIVNEVLLDEVSDTVRDEIESSAIEVILNAGEPIWYNRRSSTNSLGSGGIADKAEMKATLIENGVVSIEDNTLPSRPWNNGRTLAENLEFGYNDMTHWWDQPRSFIQQSRENLEQNKNHVEALASGLRKRGLTVV